MQSILVENLSKSYLVTHKEEGLFGALRGLVKRKTDSVEAVKDISFLIEPGELVGFIGPNGAGKTTTLKMLSGLLYKTSGRIEVLGHDPWNRDFTFLTQISLVMGQKNQLWWDLPASESFSLQKEIYQIPDQEYKETLADLIKMLDLKEILDIQVRKLSLGQRMKAELVAALIHRPRVLFLDEPTIGLDVVMQKALREFIKSYNKRYGGSIMLTSHYMDDVKELCQRVIIIDHGIIIYDGLLQDIILKFADHKIIEVILNDGKIQTHQVKRNKVPEMAAKLLKTLPVFDINIKEPEIEDVIRDVFDKNKKKS